MASKKRLEQHRSTNRPSSQPAVCDYEGSSYRTDFWTQDRTYEDAVERVALSALLPPTGQRLIEVGAGFGRLTDLYAGYHQVVLFDYSRSMLREARAHWGGCDPSDRPRYIYVAGDFNAFPFVGGLFDAVTMIRVLHHAPDAPRVLAGIGEITAPAGTFVLEFANKRNVKSIGRWLLKRQSWNPFDLAPYEFAELNFDFHPHWIHTHLEHAGFAVQDRRSVSHFRLGLLKRVVPAQVLIKLDSLIQPTGDWWQLTPSIFVKSQNSQAKQAAQESAFFRCPVCRCIDLTEGSNRLTCQDCQRAWPIHDGIYDFKEPV